MNILYRFWYKIRRPAGLIAWLGEGAKHVDQKEAERRSKICMGCPNMRPNDQIVGPTMMKIKSRMGLKTKYDDNLSTCRSCGCVISAKIWTPYQTIKEWQPTYETELLRKANPNCWQI